MNRRTACARLSLETYGASSHIAQRRLAYAAHVTPVASTIQSEVQFPFHKIMPKNAPLAMIISIRK